MAVAALPQFSSPGRCDHELRASGKVLTPIPKRSAHKDDRFGKRFYRTHFTHMRECERGYLGGSARRVAPPRVVPLASGATQQYAQIARSLRVLTKNGAGRVVLLAHRPLCDASHALPAPLLVRTHLTHMGEMSSKSLFPLKEVPMVPRAPSSAGFFSSVAKHSAKA